MIDHVDLTKVMILDIETVSQFKTFEHLPDYWKELWTHKNKYKIKEEVTPSSIYKDAGIQAEFGKIICISVGHFLINNELSFRVKSFYGHDESVILKELTEMLDKNFNSDEHFLCAHNGKEFDFPYIARRCLINGLKIPSILNNSGKKPWEVRLLDTMDLWKFGDYKNYTSLKLLAACLNLESPKDDIDGSMVGSVYWEENNLERIKKYCQKDVVTTAQVLLKFKGMEILKNDFVIFTN